PVIHHLVEPGDLVDVHEMRRLRQAKRHDGDQALASRQNAAVLRCDLGQNLQRLIERLRHVTDEGRRLHAANLPAGPWANYLYTNDKRRSGIVKPVAAPAL